MWTAARLFRPLPGFAAVAAAAAWCDEDPYSVLGVSRSASADEIRRAYKKKAAAAHPDHGGDAEEFKRVARAYANLTNPPKTASPGGGASPFTQYEEDPTFDAFRIFRDFMGGGFEEDFARQNLGDEVHTLKLRLEDLFNGGEIPVSFYVDRICEACGGRGGDTYRCSSCSGTGYVVVDRSIGGGFVQRMQSPCRTCGGVGSVLKSKCSRCAGTGTRRIKVEEKVELRRGTEHGETFRLSKAGSDVRSRRGLFRRDVRVKIEEAEHAEFQRLGPDLLVAKHISLLDALTGFVLDLPSIQGGRTKAVCQTSSLPAKPDDVWVVRDQGMPYSSSSSGSSRRRGDLYVRLIIDFPEKLAHHPDGDGSRRAELAKLIGGDPNLPSRLPSSGSVWESLGNIFSSSADKDDDDGKEKRTLLRRAPKREVDELYRSRRRR